MSPLLANFADKKHVTYKLVVTYLKLIAQMPVTMAQILSVLQILAMIYMAINKLEHIRNPTAVCTKASTTAKSTQVL